MLACRRLCGGLLVVLFGLVVVGVPTHDSAAGDKDKPAATKSRTILYVRYADDGKESYGILEGEKIRKIDGDLFGKWKATRKTVDLDDVKLLVPSRPKQVFAMAGNYKSHLGDEDQTTTTITTVTRITQDNKSGKTETSSETSTETRRSGEIPPKFKIPQPFFKTVSCLLPHGGTIILPKDATTVHYEAELVIVIGKTTRNVSKKDALKHVLGVTCGNDVSARVWQKNDVQWWRAKASDTFGPCGPVIATGLDYNNLRLTLRLNGEVRQDESTKYFINDVASMVSFLSRRVTLHPGDLIFTGTPGKTDVMKPGDVVEVELSGVGVLRNKVAAEK